MNYVLTVVVKDLVYLLEKCKSYESSIASGSQTKTLLDPKTISDLYHRALGFIPKIFFTSSSKRRQPSKIAQPVFCQVSSLKTHFQICKCLRLVLKKLSIEIKKSFSYSLL